MKNLLLALSVILSSHASSQVWGRPGATWHYTRSFISNGFITVRYASDTVIDGHSCQKLRSTLYDFVQTNAEGDMAMLTSDEGTWYTYVNGDTVFYKTSDGFRILYNFAAETGDSWVHNVSPPLFNCNDTSSVKVSSKETMIIGGQSLTSLLIEDTENNNISFNLGNSTRIVSRIGNIGGGFLFPFIQQTCDSTIFVDYYQFSFRCYEDDQIYYNPHDQHCEYFLGLEEREAFSMTVFPNPVSDFLHINILPGTYSYRVISATGQLVLHGDLETFINTASLEQGIYILQVSDGSGRQENVRFIRQ